MELMGGVLYETDVSLEAIETLALARIASQFSCARGISIYRGHVNIDNFICVRLLCLQPSFHPVRNYNQTSTRVQWEQHRGQSSPLPLHLVCAGKSMQEWGASGALQARHAATHTSVRTHEPY
jgi:hypothetical protein